MNIIYQFLYFVFALLFLIFAGFICGNFQFKFFAFLIIDVKLFRSVFPVPAGDMKFIPQPD